jgi:8-oxo-dGTP pyrophosphatase MutT (NUDIX family)
LSGDRDSKRGSAPKSAGAAKKGRGKPAAKRPAPRREAGKDVPPAQPEEVSAGGVVVRGQEVVVIVPKRRSPDGARVLGLPKGHVDPGETELQAARREVLEETGVDAEPVHKLGETRYSYKRGRRNVPKVVSFYLFRYLGGDTADHDDEVEEARWITLEEAESTLTHLAEREMVSLALASLEENPRKDR